MADDDIRDDLSRLLADVPIDFGGGCSLSKAYLLGSLIRERSMTCTLDIGVYRGRSLLPQVWAHARATGGIAYGVDPYSSREAMVHDRPDLVSELTRWSADTDFEAMLRDLSARLEAEGLADHCRLLRMTSRAAADRFRSEGTTFDLVHVDGNHDSAIVDGDVRDYVPLLRKGGFLVLDDVSWDSVRPAASWVTSRLALLFRRHNRDNDYAVFADLSGAAGVPASLGALFVHDLVVRG